MAPNDIVYNYKVIVRTFWFEQTKADKQAKRLIKLKSKTGLITKCNWDWEDQI